MWLFRLFRSHQAWTEAFLASPAVLGVIDTYGIEVIHPHARRPEHSADRPQRPLESSLDHREQSLSATQSVGFVMAWDCATTNVPDKILQSLIWQFDKRMIVLSDTACPAAEDDPTNLKLCRRGEWNDRILVETGLSMLTLVCHFKKVMHRVWEYFQARLAVTMAALHLLVQWYGLPTDKHGFVPLSITDFGL
jgi:hypothetical protein